MINYVFRNYHVKQTNKHNYYDISVMSFEIRMILKIEL